MLRALASIALTTLALLSASPALARTTQPVADPEDQRVLERTLDNGVRVIAIDVPGSGMVGVETFYSIGIAHDTPGIPQLTHLIEHLMVRGATGERGTDEAMNRLNAIGMHNAETMGSATHYDYAAPASELGTILDIERDRLTSLVIDRAIIEQEFPRCTAELTNIQRIPQAPVGKFALMAAHQVWQTRGERVSLLRNDAPPELIARAHAELYRPDALRVVIVGDVRAHEGVRLASEVLGTLPARAAEARRPIEWSEIPAEMEAEWDALRDVVIVAFPPPTDDFDRALLTLWGGVLMQQMSMMPVPGAIPGSFLTTSSPFPVGDSPFFVCAVPADGVAAADLSRALVDRIASASAPDLASMQASAVSASASQWLRPPAITPARVDAMARQLLRARNLPPEDRTKMVSLALLNHALQVGMAHSLRSSLTPADVDALLTMSAPRLTPMLQGCLARGNARVLILRGRS